MLEAVVNEDGTLSNVTRTLTGGKSVQGPFLNADIDIIKCATLSRRLFDEAFDLERYARGMAGMANKKEREQGAK